MPGLTLTFMPRACYVYQIIIIIIIIKSIYKAQDHLRVTNALCRQE